MRIAVCSLMHYRIELPFFEEWIDYHHRIGVDTIYLGIDTSKEFEQYWPSQGRENLASHVWSKHPHYDYHSDLSDDEVIEAWQTKLKGLKRGKLRWSFVKFSLTNCTKRQKTFLKDTYCNRRPEFDFFIFIDGDELLVPQSHERIRPIIRRLHQMEKMSFFGIKQCRFDKRWIEAGKSHKSVFDITTTRGVTKWGNGGEGDAFKYIVGPRAAKWCKGWIKKPAIHPSAIKPRFPDHYITIPPEDLLLYHFQGWATCKPSEEANRYGNLETFMRGRQEKEECEAFEDHRHYEVRKAQLKGE